MASGHDLKTEHPPHAATPALLAARNLRKAGTDVATNRSSLSETSVFIEPEHSS
jgi:hypothetical protein